MTYQRWYPTSTTLGDGRVLVVSGSNTCEACLSNTPEIYNPVTNTWIQLAGATSAIPLYPMMYLLPDGRVLDIGSVRRATVTQALDVNTQTWTTVDSIVVDGHSSVMYEPGKIMKSGTASDVSFSINPAAPTTYVIDMTQPAPKWQQTPSMAFGRSFHNLTLLPDGTTLATGGGTTQDGTNEANAALAAEAWSPVTKTWTTLASARTARLYHSSALLLADGRVLVAGSGRLGPPEQFNAELYSPPYLFKGPRPVVTSAPASVSYGGSFFVQTPDAVSLAAVSLIRLGTVTHAFNMDQRFLSLAFSQTTGGITVQAPANGNLAPPGYYFLFLVNSNGVPSVGAVIQVN